MRNSVGAGTGGLWFGLVSLLLLCLAAAAPADAAGRRPALSISVLWGRADLVSGGSALVAINLPGSDAQSVEVKLGRRDVTSDFAIRQDGKFEGLVTGLAAQCAAGEAPERLGHAHHVGQPCSWRARILRASARAVDLRTGNG